MKLLLDQGLPLNAASLLRQAGIDAAHVSEIGLSTAEDSVILECGRDEGHIVATLDADFHALLALSGDKAPSVIRVRIEGLKAQDISTLLQSVLVACQEDLEQGVVVTIQENRIRLRRLPLLRLSPS